MSTGALIQSYTLTPILDPWLQMLDHTRAIFLQCQEKWELLPTGTRKSFLRTTMKGKVNLFQDVHLEKPLPTGTGSFGTVCSVAG